MATTAKLIVAASEQNADLLWASGFFVPDPCIFIQQGQRKYLILSDLEYARAKKEADVDNVISYNELGKGLKKPPGFVDLLLLALKRLKIRHVEVPQDFSVRIADALRKKKIRVSLGPDPFYPDRAIKTAREVKAIEQAIRATERAIREAWSVLQKSHIKKNRLLYRQRTLTSERLKQVINVSLMEQGYVAKHTIVAGGRQAADPHCTGFGPLRAHQAIVMDVFPRSEKTGYHADITRTVCRGRAPDRLHDMYRAVQTSQAAAIKKIRHNVDASTVHRAAAETFEKRGWKTERKNGSLQGFIHSTGHGLGLDIHEYPRVSRLKNKLVAGNVVTAEPGLYYPELGGVRIEDDVLVTKTGCRVLSRLSKKFEIL